MEDSVSGSEEDHYYSSDGVAESLDGIENEDSDAQCASSKASSCKECDSKESFYIEPLEDTPSHGNLNQWPSEEVCQAGGLSCMTIMKGSYVTEKTTHLRFLLSNAEAGSVIGKGGSTINDIQSQSGARIQLSQNFEYFPGTSDRIIMVSGMVDDVLKAVELIFSNKASQLKDSKNILHIQSI